MTFAKKICYMRFCTQHPKLLPLQEEHIQKAETIGKNELKFSNSKSTPHPILKLL
jgi:hypothetical protein